MEIDEAYEAGLIPFAPIYKSLEVHFKKLDAFRGRVENPLKVFADHLEVPVEMLEYPDHHAYIDFDSADRILVKTKQTLLWVTDRSLKKHYEKVNLAAVDAMSPIVLPGTPEDQDQ